MIVDFLRYLYVICIINHPCDLLGFTSATPADPSIQLEVTVPRQVTHNQKGAILIYFELDWGETDLFS